MNPTLRFFAIFLFGLDFCFGKTQLQQIGWHCDFEEDECHITQDPNNDGEWCTKNNKFKVEFGHRFVKGSRARFTLPENATSAHSTQLVFAYLINDHGRLEISVCDDGVVVKELYDTLGERKMETVDIACSQNVQVKFTAFETKRVLGLHAAIFKIYNISVFETHSTTEEIPVDIMITDSLSSSLMSDMETTTATAKTTIMTATTGNGDVNTGDVSTNGFTEPTTDITVRQEEQIISGDEASAGVIVTVLLAVGFGVVSVVLLVVFLCWLDRKFRPDKISRHRRVHYFLRALPAIPSSLRSNGSHKSQGQGGIVTLTTAIENVTYDSTDSICMHDYSNVYSEMVDNSLNDGKADLPCSPDSTTPTTDVDCLPKHGYDTPRLSSVQPGSESDKKSPRCSIMSGLSVHGKSAIDYRSESSLISDAGTGSVICDDEYHVYEVPDDDQAIPDSSYMDMTSSVRSSVNLASTDLRHSSRPSSASDDPKTEETKAKECVVDIVDAYGYLVPTPTQT